MTRTLVMPGKAQAEDYHSLRQADYVSVLAVTDDGRVPLVRQYRPALEKFTLELPGGLRDGDEAPERAALRELGEETGLHAISAPHSLGCLAPDHGRIPGHRLRRPVGVVHGCRLRGFHGVRRRLSAFPAVRRMGCCPDVGCLLA